MCCRKWTPFPFDTRPKEKMLPRPLRWPRVTRRIKDYIEFLLRMERFCSVGRNLERDCDDDASGFIPYLVENCICHRLGQKLLIHPPGLPAVMRSDQSYVCVNFRRWNALFGEFRKVVCSFQLRRLCMVKSSFQ